MTPAEELVELKRAQARVVGQLAAAHAAMDAADRERDRLVGEARRLAVPWSRIGDAVGMARENAHRKWRLS